MSGNIGDSDDGERQKLMLGPLPGSWQWVSIASAGASIRNAIVDGPFGSNLKLSDYVENGPVPVLTTKNIDGHLDGVRYISQDKFAELSRSAVVPNDILMAKIGSCGKVGIYPADGPVAIIPANLLKMTVNRNFSLRFVYYYFTSAQFQKYLKTIIKATAQPAFGVTNFKSLPLPAAPSAEQTRIVSKVDELFSRIEEGERALERVQKLVERYRQSVLKAAVTGELTRAWREQHKGKLESGEALLQRILKARRAAWEKAELDKMKAKGQKPANDHWKQKYQEPSPPDTTDLPELPVGWTWTSVEQLCFVDTGATPRRGTAKYFDGGTIPWITSGAVNDRLISSASEFITPEAIADTNAKVFPAGSLIVAMYGEGKTRGKVSELGIDTATNQACAALICGHLSLAVKNYLRSFFEKNYLALRAQAAGGVQPNLNLSILKSTVLPFPSSASEVDEINDRLSERQSQLDAVVAQFEPWSKQSTALRQTILREAFSGTLVAQDPTDEPASILLERIAAERGTIISSPKRGRRPLAVLHSNPESHE